MNVIKRIIRKMLNWANTDQITGCEPVADSGYYSNLQAKTISSGRHGPTSRGIPFEEANRGMNFTIYNATGGKVVQLFSYNPNTDRSNSSLYIIGDKDNFGEELAMIVTRENLTR